MEKQIFKKPVLEYESFASMPIKKIILSAKNFIPDWYRKIPQYEMPNQKRSAKLCVPFLDSFLTGYIVTLPYDIYVKIENEIPALYWPNPIPNTPGLRDKPADLSLVPAGHHPFEFVWKTNVAWKVPKGYSVLFTHPLNRHDLPFTTLSAVIDGGLVVSPTNNVPFYIKKDFEGLIPQGTPIAQIIPFRQEKWKSKNKKGLNEIGQIHNDLALLVYKGWYKKTFWVKKSYD
jgi:hypothetical protein